MSEWGCQAACKVLRALRPPTAGQTCSSSACTSGRTCTCVRSLAPSYAMSGAYPHPHPHSHTHTYTHAPTHARTHMPTHSLQRAPCGCLPQPTQPHPHLHPPTHARAHTPTHSLQRARLTQLYQEELCVKFPRSSGCRRIQLDFLQAGVGGVGGWLAGWCGWLLCESMISAALHQQPRGDSTPVQCQASSLTSCRRVRVVWGALVPVHEGGKAGSEGAWPCSGVGSPLGY